MRTNAVPFLFIPGIGLAGYGLGGWACIVCGLDTWCVVVAIGTLIHMTRLVLNRNECDEVERFIELTTSVMLDDAIAS